MSNFALDMSKFVGKANKNVDLVVRKIVLDVAAEIVKRSPVDTGRFKGNWDYGFGAAPNAEYTTLDKSGDSSIGRIEEKLTGSQAAGYHFLANNLPYAQRLENGYSGQAPQGMVGLTVLKWQQIVDNAASGMA